jgi:hypothetical protein
MATIEPPGLSVETVMEELQERVRARLRQDVLRYGASRALEDPAIFADVERVLRQSTTNTSRRALLLPQLLGDPAGWRIETALSYQSHRGAITATVIRGIKQRVLMPALQWLFDYCQRNFSRQQRVNQVLFSCVQELAIENAELRRELGRVKGF